MNTKNRGPCAITNCTHTNVRFRVITPLAYSKCQVKRTLEAYPYLEVGQQLCHPHYCKIVEPNRDNKLKKNQNEIRKKKVLEPINVEKDENNLLVHQKSAEMRSASGTN